jgi:hypothetical protein
MGKVKGTLSDAAKAGCANSNRNKKTKTLTVN